jgi:hypothetical protein
MSARSWRKEMADDRRSSLDPTVRLSAYRFGAAGL